MVSGKVVEDWCAAFGYGFIINAVEVRLIGSDGEWLLFPDGTDDATLLAVIKAKASGQVFDQDQRRP